jgi:hypothetical protein
MFRSQQRFESLADAPRVRPRQIRPEDRLVHLSRAPLVARHNLAPKLPRAPVVLHDPSARNLEILGAEPRGDPARLVAIAVAVTLLRALVAAGAQRLTELFFENGLDRFEDASAQQVLDALA